MFGKGPRVFLVFGHTDGGCPEHLSLEAMARMDRALQHLRPERDILIFSGGRPAAGTTEAVKMLEYAVFRGFSGEVFLEDRSLTTIGS